VEATFVKSVTDVVSPDTYESVFHVENDVSVPKYSSLSLKLYKYKLQYMNVI